jgi:hypothetical protein
MSRQYPGSVFDKMMGGLGSKQSVLLTWPGQKRKALICRFIVVLTRKKPGIASSGWRFSDRSAQSVPVHASGRGARPANLPDSREEERGRPALGTVSYEQEAPAN